MEKIIFQALGGLGMFLFGMKIMSEGLQKVAGKKLRQILNMVSNNRFVGCGVGAIVTSIVQSSSATTVMLVSFVDTGLMSLTQAVGVILGANIGTTVTAQLIAFKITAYALPAIAAGTFLKFFIGRKKWVYLGDVLLGFGLVFFGLATMKAGFAPLRDNPDFIALFAKFSAGTFGGILLCILVGTTLTMILQSSSATVGITMALAMQGLINFETSVALILGDNIGTTITAELASIGGSINAHRTARAHTLFNVIGVTIIVLCFPYFIDLVQFVTGTLMNYDAADLIVNGEKPNIERYIANSHTLFNIVNATIFLIILPYLIKAAIWLTPHKEEEKDFDELRHIKYLDNKYVDTTSVALDRARAEIIRMGEAVLIMFDDVVKSIESRKLKELSKWKKREDTLDILQKEITQYLVKIMQQPIMPEESNEISALTRMTNNFERAGDEVENIAQLIEELIEQNLYISKGGMEDYKKISAEVRKFIIFVIEAIMEEDSSILERALEIENRIDDMREDMKSNHLMRLQSGACTVDPGLILVDMLSAFEKLGDFCFNIAQAVAGTK
ncbi:MAG: Na/Pi cotransporter family protein [Desulfobacteraceae bacterium]|jgi:phosphate:Na+ symporter